VPVRLAISKTSDVTLLTTSSLLLSTSLSKGRYFPYRNVNTNEGSNTNGI
jgi:hypothetical protein